MRTNPWILIADASAPLRGWLSRALRPQGSTLEAGSASQALWMLGEDPSAFSLLVCGPNLPDIAGPSLIAMVRTAGLPVPALAIEAFCSARSRSIVERAGRAGILEDWSDTAALRDAADELWGCPSLADAVCGMAG